MYDDPTLDQSWLANCPGFDSLKESAEGEGFQEANLYWALRDHPYRTRNPEQAALFYLPLWEYSSFRLGQCNGTTHAIRMERASRTLLVSRWFRRRGGRDHFWASSMATELSLAPMHTKTRVLHYIDKRKTIPGMKLVTVTLQQRLLSLHLLLAETSVGRMKAFGRVPPNDNRHQSQVARCTFDMGHQPNQIALRAFPPADSPRPTLLFFAGSLDVCCTGKRVRCQVGKLLLDDGDDVVIDIGLRGDTLRQMANANGTDRVPPCTRAALVGLASKRKVPVAALVEQLRASGGQDDQSSNRYEHMGRMMAISVFCLCPAGDLCTTSRFVSAIAAGCIPVVLCDGLDGPAGRKEGSHLKPVPFEKFWIKYPVINFMKRPAGLLELLRAMPAAEIARRQTLLRQHRHEVLLQVPCSTAATHFLEEVADCVQLNHHQPPGKIILRHLPHLAARTIPSLSLSGSAPGVTVHVHVAGTKTKKSWN
jgi:hypothetical protein